MSRYRNRNPGWSVLALVFAALISSILIIGCGERENTRSAREGIIEGDQLRELMDSTNEILDLMTSVADKIERTLRFDSATSMLAQLFQADPSLEEFLDANPEQREALVSFLESKEETGQEFDLQSNLVVQGWSYGTYYFRK